MPESELVIAVDTDDDSINTKDMDIHASPNSSKTAKRIRLTFPFGACRVCSDSATGIHYGIATCEGCKGFFKRSILRKEKYRCYFDNTCLVNVTNRNRCKACRFRRCIDEGMSVDGVKMGRIPKLVKERALKELKEQQMKEEAALAEANGEQERDLSCSSLSDGSIENYDPNIMETDSSEPQVSPIQRHGDVTNDYEKKFSRNSPVHNEQIAVINDIHPSSKEEKINSAIIYRTKYPTFLPDDFTADETDGLVEQPTGLLSNEVFKHMKMIANKLSATQSILNIELNDDETSFILYLRWCAYNIFLRRSKRLKQLVSRMNEMIEKNIQEYPGDNTTVTEFYHSIQLSCQVYTHSTVVYVQETPGMKNISLESLKKIITHRSFDWYLIKYHQLYNDNDQCYFLAPNGFQSTRYWSEILSGKELTDALFDFCRSLRQLNLTEPEFSLILPLQMCLYDSTIEDQESLGMLRSCYYYALYSELCYNRGEAEGILMCSKILGVLDLLIPINKLYRKVTALQILEA